MSYFYADADAFELICAQRRDDEQVQWIHDRMSDFVLRLLGDRIWIRCQRWLPSLAAFIYLSLTNLRGKQTIGEEFVGLVQIDATNRRFPSFLQRLIFVLFEVIARAPFLRFLLQQHPFVRQIHSLLHSVSFGQIHSAWFFLFNSFYLRPSKRFAHIRYLSLRPQPNSTPRQMFQLVGFATLVQFVVVLKSNIVKLIESKKKDHHQMFTLNKQQQQHTSGNGFLCKICSARLAFGQPRRPVCLPCGHSLCSDCLISLCSRGEHNNTPVECPFCRVKCPLNRIIFPLNM